MYKGHSCKLCNYFQIHCVLCCAGHIVGRVLEFQPAGTMCVILTSHSEPAGGTKTTSWIQKLFYLKNIIAHKIRRVICCEVWRELWSGPCVQCGRPCVSYLHCPVTITAVSYLPSAFWTRHTRSLVPQFPSVSHARFHLMTRSNKL